MFDLIFQAISAWNQLALLAASALLGGLGAFLLGNRLYWRIRALRVPGTIIGVRANEPNERNLYYPVYSFRLQSGEAAEATGDTASNRTAWMQTGRRVRLMVFEDSPDKVADADSYVAEITGSIAAALATALGYFALNHWPVTRVTRISLVLWVLYFAYRLGSVVARWKERSSLTAWRQANREQLKALPVRPIEEVLDPCAASTRPATAGRRQLNPVFAALFLLFGVGALVMAAYTGRSVLKLQANGLRAPGFVVRLAGTSDSEGGTVYHAVVRFSTGEGSSFEFRDSLGSYPPAYRRNDAVTVLYAAQSPEDTATIDRGILNWMGPFLTALMGLVFGAVGLGATR